MVFRRIPPPSGRATAALLLATLAGLAGLLPGAAGAADPVALLAWLVLLAPAAGAGLARSGASFVPFALAVPALWSAALVGADLGSDRDLATPLWAAAFLVGLFGLGFALGTRIRAGVGLVGGLLLLGLVLSGLPVQGGLVPLGSSWARDFPALARILVELSPLVRAYDCAGWDWVHANPWMYDLSGVEWTPRTPIRAALAGPLVGVVGCALALLGERQRRGAAPLS